MKQTNTTAMNLEQYNTLCEDFSKKSALMNEYLEASTEERKKMTSYKILKQEAQTALQKLEGWISANQ